jgi:signal peptidase I
MAEAAATSKQHKDRESLLETLESIVVAFVLAFVFRAFIIEAFVIPTGSMAPTLNGAHAEVVCSDCGYTFSVGAESPSGEPPRMPTTCVCPNCLLAQNVANQKIFSGDRILVLKYLYDFQSPQRWDVIVFHNPNDPSQNYIKRLVGLPGELFELQDGNITVNQKIARKPDKAQNALWMIVFDTRYTPHRKDWQKRWISDSDWEAKGSGFVMDKSPNGDATAWLKYRHRIFDIRSNGYTLSNVLDFYGYNSSIGGPMSATHDCTELALRTSVTAKDANSVLTFRMRSYNNELRFELTAKGSKNPTRIYINGQLAAQAPEGVLTVGKAADVRVANVDQTAMLVVDGARPALPVSQDWEVAESGNIIYNPLPLPIEEKRLYDEASNEDPKEMATEVDVGGRGGAIDLAYLRLDRDVYYLNEGSSHLSRYDIDDPRLGSQGNPFQLLDGEYFVCGDNSPKSLDSRLWPWPVPPAPRDMRPVVPQKNLVGKAFFVYWPAAGCRGGIPIQVIPDPSGWRMVH